MSPGPCQVQHRRSPSSQRALEPTVLESSTASYWPCIYLSSSHYMPSASASMGEQVVKTGKISFCSNILKTRKRKPSNRWGWGRDKKTTRQIQGLGRVQTRDDWENISDRLICSHRQAQACSALEEWQSTNAVGEAWEELLGRKQTSQVMRAW